MLFVKRGLRGELLNWQLKSTSTNGHVVRSIYEATPNCFDKTYHMEAITGETIDAQHFSVR